MTPMDDAAPIDAQTKAPLSQAELDVLTDKLIKATRPLLADEPDEDVELEEIEDTDDDADVAEEEGQE